MAYLIANGIDGNDTTGNGSEATPYKTITKACSVTASQSVGVPGDVVIVDSAVYREQILIPASKNLNIVGRGMVIVDGEGIRPCMELVSVLSPTLFHNIIFRNGLNGAIVHWTPTTTRGANTSFLNGATTYYAWGSATERFAPVAFWNCAFYDDSSSASSAAILIYNGTVGSTITGEYPSASMQAQNPTTQVHGVVHFHKCTLKQLGRVVKKTGPASGVTGSISLSLTINDSIVDAVTTATPIYSAAIGTPASTEYSISVTLTAARNSWPGATDAYHDVNITTTPPPYQDATFPNPDLSLVRGGANIASYVGNAKDGSDKGSYWFPAFGWDTAFTRLPASFQYGLTVGSWTVNGSPGSQTVTALSVSNTMSAVTTMVGWVVAWRDILSGTDWITDPNYPDGATKGGLVRINDANGDHWEIDTVTYPTATSGRLVSPVRLQNVRSGDTGAVRFTSREAVEDTTGGAGANKVVDASLADATRSDLYRTRAISAGGSFTQTNNTIAWVDAAFTADINATFTEGYYSQQAIVLTIAGQ